jgi:glycosyltransferase involved in cell wall biosynthesis
MKVLFTSYDGLTDPLGQSQILPYLSGLSAKGADIHIISFEKPERFAKNKLLIEEIVKKNNLQWTPLAYTKRPPILSTIFDLWKLRTAITKIVKHNGVDIIHSRTLITTVVCLWAQQKFNLKMIFDMRGFWADERVEGKLWNIKNPIFKMIYKFFKSKEAACLQNANHVISLTHAGKTEILKWNLNIDENKITVIPCCVDIDFFNTKNIDALNRKTIRQELEINETDTVFIYTGGIGTWYCLDEMMQFFKQYNSKNKTSKFVILTAEHPDLIYNSAKKNEVDFSEIRVKESPRNKMPNYLAAADLALFFILPSFSKTASSPTKQGEMMAMELPIICNDNVGDTGFVIRKYKAGWVVKNFTESEFNTVINDINKNELLDKSLIRKGAEEFYGLNHGVEKYWNIYQSIIKQ